MREEVLNKIEDLIENSSGIPSKLHVEKRHGNLLLIILDILKSNLTLNRAILLEFESEERIYADLVSSLENPNCSCRTRVSSYFSKYTKKCWYKIRKLLESKECEDSKVVYVLNTIEGYLEQYNNPQEDVEEKPETISKSSGEDTQNTKNFDQTNLLYLNEMNEIKDILLSISKNLSFGPSQNVMGIKFHEIMNMLPSLDSIAGKFITISTINYQQLFDLIKEHNCSYKGVSIHKEKDILHLFFY
jgi:hypothetical protein